MSLVFWQKSAKIDSVVAEAQYVQECCHLLIESVVLCDHENIV